MKLQSRTIQEFEEILLKFFSKKPTTLKFPLSLQNVEIARLYFFDHCQKNYKSAIEISMFKTLTTLEFTEAKQSLFSDNIGTKGGIKNRLNVYLKE